MESLIIFVVITILGMLFKGKQPEKNEKPAPRQPSSQPNRPDTMRKLKDLSQEMVKELQREFQTEVDEPPSRQTPPIRQETPAASKPVIPKPVKSEQLLPKERPVFDRNVPRESSRGRLSAHQGKHVWNEQFKQPDMIPKDEQDLIKGIIFSEILGPPKAKQ